MSRNIRGRGHAVSAVVVDPADQQAGIIDPGVSPLGYRLRNVVERTICRLKDWRRIATRYDRLARNFLAAVALAATIIFWL